MTQLILAAKWAFRSLASSLVMVLGSIEPMQGFGDAAENANQESYDA